MIERFILELDITAQTITLQQTLPEVKDKRRLPSAMPLWRLLMDYESCLKEEEDAAE